MCPELPAQRQICLSSGFSAHSFVVRLQLIEKIVLKREDVEKELEGLGKAPKGIKDIFHQCRGFEKAFTTAVDVRSAYPPHYSLTSFIGQRWPAHCSMKSMCRHIESQLARDPLLTRVCCLCSLWISLQISDGYLMAKRGSQTLSISYLWRSAFGWRTSRRYAPHTKSTTLSSHFTDTCLSHCPSYRAHLPCLRTSSGSNTTSLSTNALTGRLIHLQVCREADGFQPHLVSPEFGLRRMVKDAMGLVLEPTTDAVRRVHILLIEATRCVPPLLIFRMLTNGLHTNQCSATPLCL